MDRRAFLASAAATIVSPLAAAVGTTKYTLTNSAWTDLGAGPLLLSFRGRGVYAIGDTTPALLGEGFTRARGGTIRVSTTSHVWAMSASAANVDVYVSPYTPKGGGGGGSTSVWSAADAAANGMTLSNGGLTVTLTTANGSRSIRNSISRSSGKLYIEFLCNSNAGTYGLWGVGSSSFDPTSWLGNSSYSAGMYNGGNVFISAGFSDNYLMTALNPVANDVWALAVDFSAGSIWIAQNNVWVSLSNPATGSLPIVSFTPATVGALFAGLTMNAGVGIATWTLQPTPASQKYLPPPGFQAWDGGPVTPSTSQWSASDAAANAMTLSNGGLTVTPSGAGSWQSVRSSISQSSGKLYIEFFNSAVPNWGTGTLILGVGSSAINISNYLGASNYSFGYMPAGPLPFVSMGANGAYHYVSGGPNPSQNDVWAIAIDLTAGNIWLAQNNVWANGSNPATGTLPIVTYTPAQVAAMFAGLSFNGPGCGVWTLQPTAASQKYAPPAGFTAWG